MDPTRLLQADHRTVEQLFEEIVEADGDGRGPLIDKLATSLRAHMELEENLLYPAMKPVTGDEAVDEGVKEHELARASLTQMLDLAPDRPGFGAALEAVKAGVAHHVEEEENQVFPKLRKDGEAVLTRLAGAMLRERARLGLPVDGATLADASSKEELESDARRAGISGFSSMTKEQLAQSVVSSLG